MWEICNKRAVYFVSIMLLLLAVFGFLLDFKGLTIPLFLLILMFWLPIALEQTIYFIDKKLQEPSKRKSWGN